MTIYPANANICKLVNNVKAPSTALAERAVQATAKTKRRRGAVKRQAWATAAPLARRNDAAHELAHQSGAGEQGHALLAAPEQSPVAGFRIWHEKLQPVLGHVPPQTASGGSDGAGDVGG
mmetsp:Transcript_17867/g.45770  ORF Transcript_17867/g.45770 Transcript_17867/m.45770 type:complete len:120 (-) Transcript_17867:28-387(-)